MPTKKTQSAFAKKRIMIKECIDRNDIKSIVSDFISNNNISKKVILACPDITRHHSHAGEIACELYDALKDVSDVSVMIALGTHEGMTKEEATKMYPSIPYEKIINHNFRKDTVKLGLVPKEFVNTVSHGICDFEIDVNVNKNVMEKGVTVISVGQVVPHEVVGMANGNKNLFVGLGGNSMINSSHFLGACCDMEKIMGRDHSSVREVFDYAERNYLKDVDLYYFQIVVENGNIIGLFTGKGREPFEKAVRLSQERNLIYLDKPLKKVVVKLDEEEFKSTWLGNKAVYRTRLAIETGGELIILAKGIERFGEDKAIDTLIRKYGYTGRDNILKLAEEKEDLKENLSAAAHLIHGSSNGRFDITYCVEKMTKEEIEGVNFKYMPYGESVKKYDPEKLADGFNTVDGEEVFYISNPAVGLWSATKLF